MNIDLFLPQQDLIELPKAKFSPSLSEMAKQLNLNEEIIKKRKPVEGFTVDSETSRDLDDAIWLEETPTGYLVKVSIADVDFLVKAASPLDHEALIRGTTIYYPNHNIPMFPRVLSEHRLSLQEKQIRPTLTVFIELNQDLQISDVDIKETYLESSKRLSHNNFLPNLQIGSGKLRLIDYINLSKGLNERRGAEQSMAYQHFERGFSTTEEGELIEQLPTHGHLVVQEFMILANRAVAKFFQDHHQPALFRNHLPLNGHAPSRADLITLIEQNSDYLQLIDRVREVYQAFLSTASYSEHALGHVGLNLPSYLHFTSPIRRYPDLANHRIVKSLINETAPPYTREEISKLSQYFNAHLRRILTLRSSQHLPNALSIYRQNYSLLNPQNKVPSTESLQKLQEFLSSNRLGNVHFDFQFDQRINLKLTCKAWVRYQKHRFEVSVSAHADKITIKNLASNQLYKKIKSLLKNSPELFPKAVNKSYPDQSDRPHSSQVSTIQLYDHCQKNSLNRPQIHYENWNGRYSCFCQLSELVSVIGYGLSQESSKQEAVQKMLNYLSTQTKSIPPQAYSKEPVEQNHAEKED